MLPRNSPIPIVNYGRLYSIELMTATANRRYRTASVTFSAFESFYLRWRAMPILLFGYPVEGKFAVYGESIVECRVRIE